MANETHTRALSLDREYFQEARIEDYLSRFIALTRVLDRGGG